MAMVYVVNMLLKGEEKEEEKTSCKQTINNDIPGQIGFIQ